MFRRLRRTALVSSILFSIGLVTPGLTLAASWTEPFQPNRVWANRDALLIDYAPRAPIEGCNTQWIRISKTADNYDEIATFVLLAKVNGHSIKLYVHGCWDDGAGNTQMLGHVSGHVALED